MQAKQANVLLKGKVIIWDNKKRGKAVENLRLNQISIERNGCCPN